ncbi:hypothetical protein IG631_21695 [Alternaria alternata]|nr:hypothetical protein IG631_21695 [Alternaria alternata]
MTAQLVSRRCVRGGRLASCSEDYSKPRSRIALRRDRWRGKVKETRCSTSRDRNARGPVRREIDAAALRH